MTYPYLISKPEVTIISLERMKTWLRLDVGGYDEDDELIVDLIKSAVGFVEDACNLGLGVSTFQWETPCLPLEIRDTFYIQSITSITQRINGTEEVVDAENYSLRRTGPRKSVIDWRPDFRSSADLFTIVFTAGIPEDKVPPRLIMAVRALVVQWYDNREDSVSEKKTLADKLISPFVIGYAG